MVKLTKTDRKIEVCREARGHHRRTLKSRVRSTSIWKTFDTKILKISGMAVKLSLRRSFRNHYFHYINLNRPLLPNIVDTITGQLLTGDGGIHMKLHVKSHTLAHVV